MYEFRLRYGELPDDAEQLALALADRFAPGEKGEVISDLRDRHCSLQSFPGRARFRTPLPGMS